MQSLPVNVSTSGNNTIIPAVADRVITVLSYMLQAHGTVLSTWSDGVTSLTGPLSFHDREGLSESSEITYLFKTGLGRPLVLVLSDAIQVSGRVLYHTDDSA
jgi:hypothetical protein